jgi:hypothetical protein
MTNPFPHFLLLDGACRRKFCYRATPHGRHSDAVPIELSGFTRPSRGKETYSRTDENGINKKHLRWLISIVNLGKLFEVFLRQLNVAQHDAMT